MSQPSGFQQKLGLFDATMLVAGTMIGSGIFIVSCDIARGVGSSGWLMAVWVLTGVMTVIGALSYAELAAMMPHAGGQYVYLREAYSPLWGFLYGWTCFWVIQTGSIAAVGVAFAKFLGVLAPELGTENILYRVENLDLRFALYVPWMGQEMVFFERSEFTISAGQIVAVVVIAFLTYLNTKGVEEGKIVQNIFTVAKTLGLILLIVAGLTFAASPQALERNREGLWDGITGTGLFEQAYGIIPVVGVAVVLVISGAMVGSLFAADAWNNITFTAGEIKNPRRNLPWSLALGVGMVMVLYLLANWSFLSALPLKGDALAAGKVAVRQAELESQAAAAEARAAADRERVEKKRLELLHVQATLAAAVKAGHAAESRILTTAVKTLEADIDQTRNRADLLARDAATHRARAKDLNREAAFARGIEGARDDRIGTAVLERASPHFGVPLMALAIMISTFGCVNGMILMGARLYYAMAQDRLFFKSVGGLNRRGVPAVGLVLQGLWSIALVFSGSYNELLDYIIFAVLFFYVLTVAGLFILRRKYPDARRPYRAFGYPVVPALYVVLCAVIALALLLVKPVYSWPSFILLLLGIPIYFLWPGKNRAARHSADLFRAPGEPEDPAEKPGESDKPGEPGASATGGP